MNLKKCKAIALHCQTAKRKFRLSPNLAGDYSGSASSPTIPDPTPPDWKRSGIEDTAHLEIRGAHQHDGHQAR